MKNGQRREDVVKLTYSGMSFLNFGSPLCGGAPHYQCGVEHVQFSVLNPYISTMFHNVFLEENIVEHCGYVGVE